MSLELANTIGTLLTTAIVAATAIAALVQLRHLRATNQVSAMHTMADHLQSLRLAQALRTCIQRLAPMLEDPRFRAHCAAYARGEPPTSPMPDFDEVHGAATLVGNAYEELGIFVKNGLVERDLVLDFYTGPILGTWHTLKGFIAFAREAADDLSICEHFELIVVLAEDRQRGKRRSYPSGVRRIELVNPWPLAPRDETPPA